MLRPLASRGPQPWTSLATPANGATLSHDDRWLRLLQRAYGFKIAVATVSDGCEPAAACVLARSNNPLNPRVIALPFSTACPPLAIDQPRRCGVGPMLCSRSGCGAADTSFAASRCRRHGRLWTASRNGVWTCDSPPRSLNGAAPRIFAERPGALRSRVCRYNAGRVSRNSTAFMD